jgi:hypothetical protein
MDAGFGKDDCGFPEIFQTRSPQSECLVSNIVEGPLAHSSLVIEILPL